MSFPSSSARAPDAEKQGPAPAQLAHDLSARDEPHARVAHHHSTHDKFGKLVDVTFVESKERSVHRPFALRHLLGRPRVRQWIIARKLWRETEEREVDSFELLFDLVLVSASHALGEYAMEHATGITFVRFILTFFVLVSIWTDIRRFHNSSGHDDVLQRLNLMATMMLVIGFANNAAAIEIEHEETGFVLTPDGRTALNSAFGFAAVALALRISRLLCYAAALPSFTVSYLGNIIESVVLLALTIPVAFTGSLGVATGLAVALVLYEVLGKLVLTRVMASFKSMERAVFNVEGPVEPIIAPLDPKSWRCRLVGGPLIIDKSSRKTLRAMPAINLEHFEERNIAFYVLLIGEAILSVTIPATAGNFGASAQFGRAALTVLIASGLAACYFDQHLSRTFVHAARRHYFTMVAHSQLHYPTAAAVILFGASARELVLEPEAEQAYKWFFAGGISTTLVCLLCLGSLHASLDAPGSALLPRSARLGGRLVAALIIILLPLKHDIPSTTLMGAAAAVAVALYFYEQLTKLGSHAQADPEEGQPSPQLVDDMSKSEMPVAPAVVL